MTDALATLSQATRMLAEARTLSEVKAIKDIATAAAAYAHARGLGEEAETYAAEIRLEASRRIGQMMQQAKANGEIAKGGRPPENRSQRATGFGLADLGISKDESSAAQALAQIPDEEWQATKETGAQRKQTERAVAKDIKKKASGAAKRSVASSLPIGVYNVIYADPPWQYSNTGVHGAAENHYGTMSIGELETLPQNIGLSIAGRILSASSRNLGMLSDQCRMGYEDGWQYRLFSLH